MPTLDVFALAGGYLELDRGLMLPDGAAAARWTVPVPCALVVHPRGRLVFDTGVHCRTITDAVGRLGAERAQRFGIRSAPGDDVVSQLAGLGVAPADVDYVANSHFHFDHRGGNEFFPGARFLVQRREADAARAALATPTDRYRPSAQDFDHPLPYELLDGAHDVFGDGTVVLVPTYGHTPGHQSLLVRAGKQCGSCSPPTPATRRRTSTVTSCRSSCGTRRRCRARSACSARCAIPTYRRESPAKSLQQAASTIFVLMALIPFLIFVWIAFALNALKDPRVQIGLALALGLSLLGFAVLIVTMRRTATVLRMLVRADAARQICPDAPTPAAGPGPLVGRPASGPVRAAPSTRAPSVDIAPAIRSIRELREATEVAGRRWKDDAERLMGRAVRVSVVNFEQPEVGVISRVTDDGLVLENAGQEFGVLWRFVSRIELYAESEAAGADSP